MLVEISKIISWGDLLRNEAGSGELSPIRGYVEGQSEGEEGAKQDISTRIDVG
jgi:hypothetical protein